MIGRRAFVAGGVCLALSACGSKFKSYHGPDVTRVVVMKGQRQLFLMHHDTVLRTYRIGLGFAPEGDKKYEGDGRTPEGRYYIDRRNPDSDFHLSLGISYPNARDIAEARALGKSPGGDIFIHGRTWKSSGKGPDWTAGCISVGNREIEDIYAMVRDGTVIDIFP
ncbi:L,D-transpeptidase catalytic domain [Rhodovulum sp. ES.010]|uniref:L,D-transpeptidase family protein n=1 Tax=Rhodovulum sp. ES.010 TaxID=1882821 RepID=UPI0009291D21|nr:L,D-transpeptidase family protein [Rhodovulum sp. ES.010]SIO49218.1 L,D-transpeptidase catalytic domain [Rhodovulum sp. ES.010]